MLSRPTASASSRRRRRPARRRRRSSSRCVRLGSVRFEGVFSSVRFVSEVCSVRFGSVRFGPTMTRGSRCQTNARVASPLSVGARGARARERESRWLAAVVETAAERIVPRHKNSEREPLCARSPPTALIASLFGSWCAAQLIATCVSNDAQLDFMVSNFSPDELATWAVRGGADLALLAAPSLAVQLVAPSRDLGQRCVCGRCGACCGAVPCGAGGGAARCSTRPNETGREITSTRDAPRAARAHSSPPPDIRCSTCTTTTRGTARRRAASAATAAATRTATAADPWRRD